MSKYEVIKSILPKVWRQKKECGEAFAPSNIALCKYWGKRDQQLNLPVTSSLSISLGDKGATCRITEHNKAHDIIYLNGNELSNNTEFSQKLIQYLDLFRISPTIHYQIEATTNIPVAAGLASSACGYASVIDALNDLYQWQLDKTQLSILARLGSGSACRSLWHGFVEWHKGNAKDGMDSHGIKLPEKWPELRIGLLIFHQEKKSISSRQAMATTIQTSTLYKAWPEKIQHDLQIIKEALANKDFNSLGATAESNALNMHATMMASWPPIIYSETDTLMAMRKIWQLRQDGLQLFFTQDAGPHLKLLFLERSLKEVQTEFPTAEIVTPFDESSP